MAELFTLLSNGQLVEKRDIVEGLNPPIEFRERIGKFFPQEVYNIQSDSLLYKFLYALLGDAGVNGAKKALLAPKLFKALSSTTFNDLDTLFANVVQLTRLNNEIYNYDAYNQMLTQDEWAEIRRKDASYKTRAQDFMRGIHLGNTEDGFKLLGRAATGYQCQVFERWKYLDDINSDESIGYPNYGKTNAPEEVIIRPEIAALTQEEHHRTTTVLNRLKPANSIVTVDTATNALSEVPIVLGTASSSNFIVQRFVTGNGVLDYSSNKNNNWIETGIAKEAPTLAYGDRSETAIYLTINNIDASSFHLGNFSTMQQDMFAHLKRGTNTYAYSAEQAISDMPDIYKVSFPWLIRQAGKDSFVVNDYYPLGYFGDEKFNLNKPSKLFWASEELEPDAEEDLYIDFGSTRPINMMEFEISQKPIDIFLYYWDDVEEDWELVEFRNDVNNITSVDYGATNTYTWQSLAFYFNTVETQRMRVRLARRPEKFPFPYSPIFPWSIEIRNLKCAQVIAEIEDFVPNFGVDVLGNSYTTDLKTYSANQAWDGEENTYWQSQINPSRFAVESLYFDVSDNDEPSLVDEVYLDPLTPECLMHIYYSNDDSNSDNWDNKLWIPVPRHYLLTKGNVKLFETIRTKYIKLEFTKLNVLPYNTLSLPIELNKTYRMYPSWVESYIFQTQTMRPADPLTDNSIYGEVNPSVYNLGIVRPTVSKLEDEVPKTILNFIRENRKTTTLSEYQVWKNPDTNKDAEKNPQTGQPINLYPNSNSNLYQQQILNTVKLKDLDAKWKYLRQREDNNNWIPEWPIQKKYMVAVSTKDDRTPIVQEKNWPDMWFMRKCRHAYKIVQAPRTASVGYHVAIREVKFYKRDKTAKNDDISYVENILDEGNISKNTWYQNDWRWTLTPENIDLIGSTNIVEYGSESFNGVAF